MKNMRSDRPTSDEHEDNRLRKLFRQAHLRESPPEEFEHRAREALHAQWRQMVDRRARNRRMAVAIAASLLIGLVAIWFAAGVPPARPVDVATVLRQEGTTRVENPDAGTPSVISPAPPTLLSGSAVATSADASLLMRWTTGATIRMDRASKLRLVSTDRIELVEGRIYVDSGHGGGTPGSLVVGSPFGDISHIGTQYMARLTAQDLQVTVREGRVSVLTDSAQPVASRGIRLTIGGDGNAVREAVPAFGAEWQWAEAIRAPFELDGRTVHELVAEIARETGRSVEYADERAERTARTAILQGTLDASPLDALQVVLMSAALHSESDGSLIIVSSD